MPNTTHSVTLACIMCDLEVTITVPDVGYDKWRYNELHIQEAMPDLTLDEREMFISRTCNACWDAIMPEDEHADSIVH